MTALLAAFLLFLAYVWAFRAIQRQRTRRQRATWMQRLATYARRDKAIQAARARNAVRDPNEHRGSQR